MKNLASKNDIFSIIRIYPAKPFLIKQPESSNKNNQSSLTEFLHQYFRFAYFFCVSPYKFVRKVDGEGEHFAIRTNWLQQVMCGILHSFNLYRVLFAAVLFAKVMHGRDGQPKEEKIAQYLDTAVYVSFFLSSLYEIIFVFSLWKNKLACLNVLLEIGKISEQFGAAGANNNNNFWFRRNRISRMAITTCCIIFFFILPCFLSMSGYLFFELREWSLERLLQNYVGLGRSLLFLQQENRLQQGYDEVNLTNNENNALLTAVDFPIALIAILAVFYKQCFVSSLAILILMSALTFHCMSKEFIAGLSLSAVPPRMETERTFKHKHLKVLKAYNSLKRTMDKLNMVIGPLLFIDTLAKVSYIATYIGWILKAGGWIRKLRDTLDGFIFFGILFIAAHATHKVERLADWLKEGDNGALFTSFQLNGLLDDTLKHRVGICCMGLFTVTYGFIGTITSFILTFVVIVLQQ